MLRFQVAQELFNERRKNQKSCLIEGEVISPTTMLRVSCLLKHGSFFHKIDHTVVPLLLKPKIVILQILNNPLASKKMIKQIITMAELTLHESRKKFYLKSFCVTVEENLLPYISGY